MIYKIISYAFLSGAILDCIQYLHFANVRIAQLLRKIAVEEKPREDMLGSELAVFAR